MFGHPDNLCPGCNPSWCPKRKLDKAHPNPPAAFLLQPRGQATDHVGSSNSPHGPGPPKSAERQAPAVRGVTLRLPSSGTMTLFIDAIAWNERARAVFSAIDGSHSSRQ